MVDVMTLLEESRDSRVIRCKTCIWLSSRPEDERKKWVEVLEQPKTWGPYQVSRAMAKVEQAEGAPESPPAGSISNHRSGHVKSGGTWRDS